jgi:hypothetical protein
MRGREGGARTYPAGELVGALLGGAGDGALGEEARAEEVDGHGRGRVRRRRHLGSSPADGFPNRRSQLAPPSLLRAAWCSGRPTGSKATRCDSVLFPWLSERPTDHRPAAGSHVTTDGALFVPATPASLCEHPPSRQDVAAVIDKAVVSINSTARGRDGLKTVVDEKTRSNRLSYVKKADTSVNQSLKEPV